MSHERFAVPPVPIPARRKNARQSILEGLERFASWASKSGPMFTVRVGTFDQIDLPFCSMGGNPPEKPPCNA